MIVQEQTASSDTMRWSHFIHLARKICYKATNLFNRVPLKMDVVLSPTLSGNDDLCSDTGVTFSGDTHDYITYATWFLVADKSRVKGLEGQVVEARSY